MKPFRDSDLPLALAGTPLADQFRYWTGASGRRYLHKILPIAMAPDFRHCSLVLATVRPDGAREAVWVGTTVSGTDRAIAAARMAGATEAHVHLLTETADEARHVAEDIRLALEASEGSVAA